MKNITEIDISFEKGEAFFPIFIIGSGRSGNTLLRRFLTAGDDVYIPPETYVLGEIIACARGFTVNSDWEELVGMVLGKLSSSEDFATFPTQDLRPLEESLNSFSDERRSVATVLDTFYRYMASAAGSSALIWGDKTPLNTACLDSILKVFPKARMIWIYRNGYDVVSSYLSMGRYSDPVEAATRWLKSNIACAAFERQNEAQVFKVAYEDLVSDPELVLSRLCVSLGIPFSIKMITSVPGKHELGDTGRHAHHARVHEPVDTHSIGRGLREMSKETVALLAPIIASFEHPLGE